MSVLIVAGLDSSTGRVWRAIWRCWPIMDPGAGGRDGGDGAGCLRCMPHPSGAPAMVSAQIRAAGAEQVAKLGMLANAAFVSAIADALPDLPFVLDPVLATSAGVVLPDGAGRAAMIAKLIPRAALVTPKLPEATALTGLASEASRKALATAFFAMGARAVLLKGGHAGGAEAVDWLLRPGAATLRFAATRKSGNRRETGCTLSSAIAAHLARGDDLASACGHAKRYLCEWI